MDYDDGSGDDVFNPGESAQAGDDEDLEEGAMGETVFAEENDADDVGAPVPHGAGLADYVAPTLFAEDGMSQDAVTHSIEDDAADRSRMARAYESKNVRKMRLSTLHAWCEEEEDVLAMKSLLDKNLLHIDGQYLVNANDPNVSWTTTGTFLDYRQIVSRPKAMDVLLPNANVPGSAVDHRWHVTLSFSNRYWHFRGDVAALGCDMGGRMMHIGFTMAKESIWIGFLPKHVYTNPPHIGDVKLEKRSTTMQPNMSRAVVAGLLYVMEKSGFRDVALVNDYPDISSDAEFSYTFDLSESKTFEFSFTQMRSLCNHFQNHWDDYIKNAPAAYKFPELLDSYPVFVTLRYGQNRLLNTREGIDDTANAWNAEVDYSKVWRTSFALATHYTAYLARAWNEVPVHEIRNEHPVVYDSPNRHRRQEVVDLANLPLLDENGREIQIYSEDGYRIARRTPDRPRRMDRCAIMQDLRQVSSLFLHPDTDYDLAEADDEVEEDEEPGINGADFALNEDLHRARARQRSLDTKYTFYPHFYSKHIGQWQADGVINPLVQPVRELSRRLTQPGAAGVALVAMKSQCYNSSAHSMRFSSGTHIVQKGLLTAAATGAWASGARGNATAHKLFGKAQTAFPHERVTAQLQRENSAGKLNSLRLENNFLVDFNHVRDEHRNGDALFRQCVLILSRLCGRSSVVDALRTASALFKYKFFPEIYEFATYPVTSTIEAVWKHHIEPNIRAAKKPKPQYVELLASLERALNYAYTGAAAVIPRQLFRGLWMGRSLLQTGGPMLWPGLVFHGDTPTVRLQLWPLDSETQRPLTASRRAQEITYGVAHYLGYETLFYVQSRISCLPNDLWSDASLLGRQLRLLAQIAIRSFVEDTVDLVNAQVLAEIKPILVDRDSENYTSARARYQALKSWLLQPQPLDFGEQGSTLALLTRIVCANATEAALGLPGRGQWGIDDFVSHLITVACGASAASVRPPVSRKGRFWPVLRTVVSEAKAIALRGLAEGATDAEVMLEIKAAFTHVVVEERVRMVPQAFRDPVTRRPSVEPSIHSWATLGVPARRPASDGPTYLTAREREDQQLVRLSLETWENDPSSEWDTSDISIEDYHRFLGRTSLPVNWSYQAAISDSRDALVSECYQWARECFLYKLEDWRCDLALHLAYLISKVAPSVGWPTDARLDLAHLNAEEKRARIQAVRALPWVVKNARGAKEEHIYYTQASIVFLCWMHSQSPLRRRLQQGKTLGDGWTKKHGNKCLTPVNLIRMGIAYPLSNGVIGRPIYKSNFAILSDAGDDPELRVWWREVRTLLHKNPYSLVRTIFGDTVTNTLIDRGHFSKRQQSSQSASTGSSQRSAPRRSSQASSSKRTFEQVLEEEEEAEIERSLVRRRRF